MALRCRKNGSNGLFTVTPNWVTIDACSNGSSRSGGGGAKPKDRRLRVCLATAPRHICGLRRPLVTGRARAADGSALERHHRPAAAAYRSTCAGPIAGTARVCITEPMEDVDAHEYRLGTPAASIVGMTQRLLEREDLPEEVVTHLRAIRELALEIVREAEKAGEA